MKNEAPELNKYIVCFQCSFSIGYEKKTRVQFYQYFAKDAAAALKAAEPTKEMLSSRTGRDYVIEGVYEQCRNL